MWVEEKNMHHNLLLWQICSGKIVHFVAAGCEPFVWPLGIDHLRKRILDMVLW